MEGRSYPYVDGDVTVLGPEIFVCDGGETICWKGRNYVKQAQVREFERRNRHLKPAMKTLLYFLDRQYFQGLAPGKYSYSENVMDAMARARRLVEKLEPDSLPDPKDVARPVEQ